MIDEGHSNESYWTHPPNLNGFSSDELLDLKESAFLPYMTTSRAFRETAYGVSAARAMAYPKAFGTQRALDFGCGVGYDAVSLAELGWRVALCDLHEKNRMVASRWLGLLGLPREQVVSPNHLSYFESAFSLVLSYGVIHHIPQPVPVVRQLQQCVAPGGSLLLMLYTQHFVPEVDKRSDGKIEGPYTRGYNLDEVAELLGPGWGITRTERWNNDKYRAITAMRLAEMPF